MKKTAIISGLVFISLLLVSQGLFAQRSPDLTKIEKIWDAIYKLEYEIQNKEILHDRYLLGVRYGRGRWNWDE